ATGRAARGSRLLAMGWPYITGGWRPISCEGTPPPDLPRLADEAGEEPGAAPPLSTGAPPPLLAASAPLAALPPLPLPQRAELLEALAQEEPVLGQLAADGRRGRRAVVVSRKNPGLLG